MYSAQEFQALIYDYYKQHGRTFSWRETQDPYHIFISEVMLQQTQTDRVKEKYIQWITALPSFEALAQASIAEVICLWQGLGYNRRALNIHKSAQIIVENYAGKMPAAPDLLVRLPGIGKATAASICAFAFNMPTVFIETNIRAVYIHSFFPQRTDVADSELFPLIEQTVDKENARIWYYALMDYGVMLKKKYKNPSKKSAHYTVQSKFEGSDRQIRGMILKALATQKVLTYDDLLFIIPREPARILSSIEALCAEGFVCLQNDRFYTLRV